MRTERRLAVLAGTAGVIFAVLLAGGYGLGWTWTGFADEDTLWDWLQLMVLPLTLAAWTLWVGTNRRMNAGWWAAAAALLVAFAVVLYGGYALHWRWTGFQGNTLWDWWRLLLVPFVLPAALTWASVRERRAASGADRAPARSAAGAQRRPASPAADDQSAKRAT